MSPPTDQRPCTCIPILSCKRLQNRTRSSVVRIGQAMLGAEDIPLPNRLVGLGECRKLPYSGVRAEPRPKLNLVKSECQRCHLVICISNSLNLRHALTKHLLKPSKYAEVSRRPIKEMTLVFFLRNNVRS